MGMRMMFTMFLLVVLATTVVSFTLDQASDGRNIAVDDRWSFSTLFHAVCCAYPHCRFMPGC
nr:TPA_inf: conotoxin precursor A [Conus ebraeus]